VKLELGNITTYGAVIIMLMTHSLLSQAVTLFAHANNDQLYLVDIDTVSASVVGPNNTSSILTEIEQSPTGTIFGSDTLVNTNLLKISPDTGAVFDIKTMTFPAGGDVITAMEFVDNTLYAGFAMEGIHSGPGASSLVTIDPLTGDVALVGPTGISNPLGGLAWDGTTMYAVSSGGTGSLYTIDLETGAATLVGDTGFTLTALEFGENGLLYGLPRMRSSSANHLLRIDTVTGAGIDLGLIIGAPSAGLVSLTSTPPQVPIIDVTIEIKPGNSINPVNPKSKGNIKVAILTTEDFDASLVDASTLSFGRGEALPVTYRLDDIDLDGDWDLVLKFHTMETGIVCGDVNVTISGQMLDGTSINGTDSVHTVGC
jgi:hypothetical protein